MEEKNPYAIDANFCPKYDNILYRNQCNGCEHYIKFEMYKGQPCVRCSYDKSTENE